MNKIEKLKNIKLNYNTKDKLIKILEIIEGKKFNEIVYDKLITYICKENSEIESLINEIFLKSYVKKVEYKYMKLYTYNAYYLIYFDKTYTNLHSADLFNEIRANSFSTIELLEIGNQKNKIILNNLDKNKINEFLKENCENKLIKIFYKADF